MSIDLFSSCISILFYIFRSYIVNALGIIIYFPGGLQCFIQSKTPWIIKCILISETLKCEKVHLRIKKTWYLSCQQETFVLLWLIRVAFVYVSSDTDITIPTFFFISIAWYIYFVFLFSSFQCPFVCLYVLLSLPIHLVSTYQTVTLKIWHKYLAMFFSSST